MAGDAVQFHLRLLEDLLDVLGGLKAAFVVLEHEVRRLTAGGAGLLRIVHKIREGFGSMLSALDTGMKNNLSHSLMSVNFSFLVIGR